MSFRRGLGWGCGLTLGYALAWPAVEVFIVIVAVPVGGGRGGGRPL